MKDLSLKPWRVTSLSRQYWPCWTNGLIQLPLQFLVCVISLEGGPWVRSRTSVWHAKDPRFNSWPPQLKGLGRRWCGKSLPTTLQPCWSWWTDGLAWSSVRICYRGRKSCILFGNPSSFVQLGKAKTPRCLKIIRTHRYRLCACVGCKTGTLEWKKKLNLFTNTIPLS